MQTPGQSAAAFLRGDSNRPSLLACPFAGRRDRRGHIRRGWGIFRRGSKTLEEIADQSPQPNVFRDEVFHLRHRRCVRSTEPPPSIERPKRYACSAASADKECPPLLPATLEEMVWRYLARTNLTRNDAYMLCSLASNLRVSQLVDGNKGFTCYWRNRICEN